MTWVVPGDTDLAVEVTETSLLGFGSVAFLAKVSLIGKAFGTAIAFPFQQFGMKGSYLGRVLQDFFVIIFGHVLDFTTEHVLL